MKRFPAVAFIILALIAAASIIASCTQEEVTTTTTLTVTTSGPTATSTITNTQTTTKTTTVTASPTQTTTPTATGEPTATAGELSSLGVTLYGKSCTLATDCHARFGQGGETEFTAEKLSSFDNAERVFNLISSIMHLNIGDYQEDAPTQEEYLQILAYILTENDIVADDDLFDRSILPNIQIEKPEVQLPTTTAGELASYGGTVFSSSCVLTYCHEPWEPDGKTHFAEQSWEYFNNAQKYFDFTKRFMPGESPGSLTDDEYLEVIAFILTEINKIQSEDLFGLSNLSSILLN